MSPTRSKFANITSAVLTAVIVVGIAVMIYLSQRKEQFFPMFFPQPPAVIVDEEMSEAIYQQIDEEVKIQEEDSDELKFDKFASKKKLEAIAEEKRKAEEAEKKRLADLAEKKRLADLKKKQDEERKKKEAEAKRLAEIKKKEEDLEKQRLANEAEKKRLEDLKKKQEDDAEKKRLDDERKKKEAEERRKADEAAAKAKADADARAKAVEAENYRQGEAYLSGSNIAGAIQQALYNNWSPDQGMAGYKATVILAVDKDGYIMIDEKKSKFSGFTPLDSSVRAAVSKTKRITMPNDKNAVNVLVKMGIQVTFDPTEVGF